MKVKLQMFLTGVVVLLLTGCTGLNPERYLLNKTSFMLNQGNPPMYVAGYVDGCSAGRRLGGDKRFVYRKNNTRFDKDALYARGWQEGQINCRNETLTESVKRASEKENKGKGKETETDSVKALDAERHRRVEAESRAAETEMREIWEELKK